MLIADVLPTIRTLYRQPDTLSLWGIPYAMREGQTPRDIWNAPRPDLLAQAAGRYGATMHAPGPQPDWVWLGCPGWWGSIDDSRDQRAIVEWLATLGDSVPVNPCEWASVQVSP